MWTAVDVLLGVFGMWLAATAPISFAGGTYDDLLYIRLATSIVHGHWLGPFHQLTLARGPVFPLFLAAIAVCHIPVNMAAQGVYLTGSLVLARQVGQALRSRPAATAMFALLAFNPVPFAALMALVMREKLYVGETMLVLALMLRLLPTGPGVTPGRLSTPGWSLATGLALGIFWLTREEGVWILPALFATLAIRLGHGAWQHLHIGLQPRPRLPALTAWLVPEALVYLLLAAGFLVVALPFAAINHAVYGVFRTSDFQSGPFPDAYGAMLRVRPEHWRRHGILPRDVRAGLYGVSEAARELEPALEGRVGQEWTRIGCKNDPTLGCDDLQGGWAMFAVRQAAADAGHYATAADADRFYKRLAAEINAACDAKTLSCSGPRSGMLPPFRWTYVRPALRSLLEIARQTVSLRGSAPGAFLASPSLLDMSESRAIAFGEGAPTQSQAGSPTLLMTGWLDTASGDPASDMTVIAAPGQSGELASTTDAAIPAIIGRQASKAARFQIRCTPTCRLRISQGAVVLLDRVLSGFSLGMTSLGQDILLNVDSTQTLPPPDLMSLPFKVASVVAAVVRAINLFALPLAALGTPVLFVWDAWNRRLRPIGLIAVVLLIALLTRMMLLAISDATVVPALEFRFLAPGFSIGVALSGIFLVYAVTSLMRGQRAPEHLPQRGAM